MSEPDMIAFARRVQQVMAEGDPAQIAQVVDAYATVWENVDQKTRSFAQVARFHHELAARLERMDFLDSVITPTASGYIDQHVKKMTTKSGQVFLVPSCIVIDVREGKIRGVREYLDSAHFPPEVRQARQAAD